MKKAILLLFAGTLLTKGLPAQKPGQNNDKNSSKAMSNTLAFGFSLPMGTFNRTHSAGIMADYSRSTHRYGNNAIDNKLINFVVNAGVGYYAGKSTSVSGYEFRYGGYFTVHAAGGIDYKPAMPVNISLTAGPLLSIYEGNAGVGAVANLFWSYFLSKNIALGPGLSFRKESKKDALWSGTMRASYAF
jgi:hypothetical protein